MAKVQFTLKEYIANPMGDSTVTHRELYRKMYSETLDKFIEKKGTKAITYNIYTDEPKDRYYIHFKIPSERVEDLYYDTVIYFYPTKETPINGRTISNHCVKFFSNDMAFNFVYVYNFNKQGLLIEDLKSKLNKKALDTKPNSTNPNSNIGYIKTIYLAYLIMEKYDLFYKSRLKMYGTNYSKSKLLNEIASYDDKNAEYFDRKQAQTTKDKKKKNELIKDAKKIAKKTDVKMRSIETIKPIKNNREDKRLVEKVSPMKLLSKRVGKIKKK